MNESDGVLLVYNPDAPSQDQQIGDWFEFFVRKNNLRDEQCMVFAHRSNSSNGDKFRPRESR
jgi:intraflagellar transport protein 22